MHEPCFVSHKSTQRVKYVHSCIVCFVNVDFILECVFITECGLEYVSFPHHIPSIRSYRWNH